MRWCYVGVYCAWVLFIAASAGAQDMSVSQLLENAISKQRIVDLTHVFSPRTIYWPTEDGFQLIRGKAGVTEKGYYYAANRFNAAEHGGTHVDAPRHFSAEGQTVEAIPLGRLMGDVAVVDVVAACRENPDYQIDISDLRRWEEVHQRPLFDVIVFFRTGYAKRWPDRKKYLGTEKRGKEGVQHLHFPGLAPRAARWLAEERGIRSVGIDTASIDHGQSKQFGSHVVLFAHQIPAIENLGDLSRLPTFGATVIALPMKIGGGSGSPTRVIAVLPPERDASR